MRTKGYKCSNVNCGSCVGHSLCGEPADTALGCASRMVNMVTNADRIRSMSDEDLAKFLECFGLCHYCTEHHRLGDLRIYADEKCDEKCVEHCLEWLKQPAEE